MGVGEKVAPKLFVRELSREAFRGEAWISAAGFGLSLQTCFEQLARTLINSGAEIETGWRSCQGKATFFAQVPARSHAQHSWRSWARLLTSGSEGGPPKAPLPFPAARGQGSDRIDDRGV